MKSKALCSPGSWDFLAFFLKLDINGWSFWYTPCLAHSEAWWTLRVWTHPVSSSVEKDQESMWNTHLYLPIITFQMSIIINKKNCIIVRLVIIPNVSGRAHFWCIEPKTLFRYYKSKTRLRNWTDAFSVSEGFRENQALPNIQRNQKFIFYILGCVYLFLPWRWTWLTTEHNRSVVLFHLEMVFIKARQRHSTWVVPLVKRPT